MAGELYEVNGTLRRRIATADGVTRFEAEQDVSGIIEHCKAMREQVPNAYGRDLVPVAEIPLPIYEQAVQEGWHNDPKAWRRWLRDPDNKHFRTYGGRHR